MSRRLDIAVASYKNPQKLQHALQSIATHSLTDWRCFIIHNPADGPEDAQARAVIQKASEDKRFCPVWLNENVGYAGAVNKLFELAETEYCIHLDNDIEINTHGWDETLCSYLDRFHELAAVFPNGGAYPIKRAGYTEILWGVGFCFVTSRIAIADIGQFDESLGHQDEVDWQTRARLAGYRIGAAPEVHVQHHATATNDPGSIERINSGVRRWVDRWEKYFVGKNAGYTSPTVLRFELWPPTAIYMEEWFKRHLPNLNDNPEVVRIGGIEYDLIKVPRLSGFYRGRII